MAIRMKLQHPHVGDATVRILHGAERARAETTLRPSRRIAPPKSSRMRQVAEQIVAVDLQTPSAQGQQGCIGVTLIQSKEGMMALLDCPNCKATNRLPSTPTQRMRCSACKREFKPADLTKIRPEPPPERPTGLDFDGEPAWECIDEDDCGWSGEEAELEKNATGKKICPDCGHKVRKLEREDQEEPDDE